MIIKTKKYQFPKKTYISIGLSTLVKNQWWYLFGPILFGCIAFALPSYKWWFIIPAILTPLLYILFWAIQFAGVTQLEQNKIMFEKLAYEIDSRQILIRLNAKEGSIIPWNMIKKGSKNKDHFLLEISKGQLIHLPFKIFNSDNDIRFMESILRKKSFLPTNDTAKVA
ncbi:MAG: YcxB family protein [Cytophagales bacterium]|nr:MAG: YcxB family protein [Cytophagales bacterium]